jgi:hypothetical protein
MQICGFTQYSSRKNNAVFPIVVVAFAIDEEAI